MLKTKKTSEQINEVSEEPIPFQLLVKLDQSSKVYQFSMIDQTLCIVQVLENSCYG